MTVKMEQGRVQEKEWPQILAVIIACLSSFTGGILFNWPSPSIPILISENDYLQTTLEMASYLTVIPSIALILIAFPACRLIDSFGRKNALLLTAIPYVISWILISIGHSIWVLYVSRFINGIGDTLIFATLPVYIGEITTPKMRGSWGNAMTLLLFFGGFCVNSVGAYFTIRETAYIFILIPIVYFFAFWYMPESPYYYVIKGREEEAKTSLRWLRGKYDVESEYKEISTAVKRQLSEPGTIKDLFAVKTNRKAIIICGIMRFTQQFSGISAFSVYTQHLFNEAGGDISASASAMVFSGIMMVVSVAGSVVLDRLGRRKALFISGTGCVIILFAMGTFLKLKTIMDLSAFLWFPVVGMTVFIALFSIGFAIVPTLMLGEMFSSSIKGNALAFMNVIFGILLASSTKIFQLLLSSFGLYAPFLFYGTCCFVGTVICYYIVPETKGKTLDEIQLELHGVQLGGKIKPGEEVASNL